MIITLKTPLARGAFIVFFLMLSSCSIIRMTYNRGPQISWWWLDGYVDFNNDQVPQAKAAIHEWFDWHRRTQLPKYATWLSAFRYQINGSVTPEQVCGWYGELQDTISLALDYALQLGAPLVTSLSEEQLRHIEQRYAKNNKELRRDYLQSSVESRQETSFKRITKRIEDFYGRLDEAQKRLITDSIISSPFDPVVWLTERQHRQNVTLVTLRQLITEPTEAEHIITTLRSLVEHTKHSTNPEYRAYQIKLTDHNCAFIALIHNSTNQQQRQHASDKLKGWETDLLLLSTQGR